MCSCGCLILEDLHVVFQLETSDALQRRFIPAKVNPRSIKSERFRLLRAKREEVSTAEVDLCSVHAVCSHLLVHDYTNG